MHDTEPTVRDPSREEYDTTRHLAKAEEQAIARQYEDFMIIDADAHHYESSSKAEIFNYLENPVLRDLFKSSNGETMMPRSTGGYQELGGRIVRNGKHRTEKTPPGAPREATLTTRWMDSLGVDVACLFPTPMLGFGLQPVVEVEVGYARAYNRWLVDNVLSKEKRIVSMLYLPMNDPIAAVKMVEELGDKPGVVGFMITSVRYKPLHDNVYMKLYATLEERGLPLAFHSATNWQDQSMIVTNRFISAHALGFAWFNIVHMTNWVINGLPERFPKLKTIWIESGLAWIPFLMQRLDNEYMMRSSEVPSLKRKPSDYMREMFYTSQPMEMVNNRTMLEETFKMIAAETQLLYASDYPHWDMDLPGTIHDLPFLSVEAKRNILGESARKLFKLPVTTSPAKQARRIARGLSPLSG